MGFAPGSITSVAGFELALGGGSGGSGSTVQGAAGRIRATAATPGAGGITLAGLLDVSAPGSAATPAASKWSPQAASTWPPAPALLGSSSSGLAGGFALDTGTLAQDGQATVALDPLARALDQGGLHDTVTVRVRQGDLALESATLRAQTATLSADQGRLHIGGTLDAQAAAGGRVQLFAGAACNWTAASTPMPAAPAAMAAT